MGLKPPESVSKRLYFEHAAALAGALLRLGVPRADVDDAVHDVFLVVMRRANELAEIENQRAWLYAIAIKVAATRRRWHRLKTFVSLENTAVLRDESGPLRRLEQQQASTQVNAALAVMRAPKREVFVLFELEGFSGPEIAALLGCPLNTVWTRLFHARKDFATALERQPRGTFDTVNQGEES